jgi:hypothetical protein
MSITDSVEKSISDDSNLGDDDDDAYDNDDCGNAVDNNSMPP